MPPLKYYLYTLLYCAMVALWPEDVHCQAIQMHGYVSYYNPATRIPDSVIYTAQPHARVATRLPFFHGSNAHSYQHSGYDTGHMMPAEDADYSDSSEYDSFNANYNAFPQVPNCNRDTWRVLENYVRGLGVPVRVKISWQGEAKRIGRYNIVVPMVCVKELWYQGKYERYAMPNVDTVNRHEFQYYQTAHKP
jgi:DNA/RNA endonuclease G (NUC1)